MPLPSPSWDSYTPEIQQGNWAGRSDSERVYDIMKSIDFRVQQTKVKISSKKLTSCMTLDQQIKCLGYGMGSCEV